VSINVQDENTYTIDGNYIYLWVLYDLKKPLPDIASWVIYTKGNCKTIETKAMKKIYYSENMTQGDVVMTKGEDSEWEVFPPGSAMYSIIKTFCD